MSAYIRGCVSGCFMDFFTYETTKSVVVKSWSVGIINRVVQLLIVIYFVCYVFLYQKAYQLSDTGIESSVMTKVKGYGYLNNEVMDVADYVAPTQGAAVFCVITSMVTTENQTQGTCPEGDPKYSCSNDSDCEKYIGANKANGVIMGKCQNGPNKTTKGRCIIQGWCPAEVDSEENKKKMDVANFTIFIKNSIRFPMFNVTRGNIPSGPKGKAMEDCLYNPVNKTFCPYFRVGDVLSYSGQELQSILDKGGEIGINIEWKCNLDMSIEKCQPKYSFTRLDAAFENHTSTKGYNFRFAKYYKEDGKVYRTLHKAFAIRFDILVTGTISHWRFQVGTFHGKIGPATPPEGLTMIKDISDISRLFIRSPQGQIIKGVGDSYFGQLGRDTYRDQGNYNFPYNASAGKFNPVPTLINLVTAFTSVGLGTVLCDIILLNFLKGADQYKAKKFEEVSDTQILSFHGQNGSQQSVKAVKPEENSRYDSGTISLSIDQVL